MDDSIKGDKKTHKTRVWLKMEARPQYLTSEPAWILTECTKSDPNAVEFIRADNAELELTRMRDDIDAALSALDASRFTNAEHARAKSILRAAMKEPTE